jgi:hypothetical protein
MILKARAHFNTNRSPIATENATPDMTLKVLTHNAHVKITKLLLQQALDFGESVGLCAE